MSVKALTLHQPWASLVALLVKRIETRSWSTKYRGRLYIHASKNQSALCYFAWLEEHHGVPEPLLEPFSGLLTPTETNSGLITAVQGLPLGAVVASCELVDVVPTGTGLVRLRSDAEQRRDPDTQWEQHPWPDRLTTFVHEAQLPYGDFSPGRFAWLLGDVRPVDPPVPCRGYQGLWTPSDEVLAQLEGAAA